MRVLKLVREELVREELIREELVMSGTLGLAGEGLGLFFTSIQDSESRSGRLAERPLGIVFRLDTSPSGLVCWCTGVEDLDDPAAETQSGALLFKYHILNIFIKHFKHQKLLEFRFLQVFPTQTLSSRLMKTYRQKKLASFFVSIAC